MTTEDTATSDGDSEFEPPFHAHSEVSRARQEEIEPIWAKEFRDPTLEYKRLFSELLGTFFLVLVAAGGPTISAVGDGTIGRAAAVTAPGLMVLAIILFMGAVSGAHLNPVVSLAFALRKDFPWKKVPAYIAVQIVGAILASLFLWTTFGRIGMLGATLPGRGISDLQALAVEIVLTMGLVSTILGTASKAQNVGTMSAVAVGAYIILAGLWASPISGASMNPARSLGPAIALNDYSHLWVYIVGPLAGAILAVGASIVLRGAGGRDPKAREAAQGRLQ